LLLRPQRHGDSSSRGHKEVKAVPDGPEVAEFVLYSAQSDDLKEGFHHEDHVEHPVHFVQFLVEGALALVVEVVVEAEGDRTGQGREDDEVLEDATRGYTRRGLLHLDQPEEGETEASFVQVE
jgi:hypothetical protein